MVAITTNVGETVLVFVAPVAAKADVAPIRSTAITTRNCFFIFKISPVSLLLPFFLFSFFFLSLLTDSGRVHEAYCLRFTNNRQRYFRNFMVTQLLGRSFCTAKLKYKCTVLVTKVI